MFRLLKVFVLFMFKALLYCRMIMELAACIIFTILSLANISF